MESALKERVVSVIKELQTITPEKESHGYERKLQNFNLRRL